MSLHHCLAVVGCLSCAHWVNISANSENWIRCLEYMPVCIWQNIFDKIEIYFFVQKLELYMEKYSWLWLFDGAVCGYAMPPVRRRWSATLTTATRTTCLYSHYVNCQTPAGSTAHWLCHATPTHSALPTLVSSGKALFNYCLMTSVERLYSYRTLPSSSFTSCVASTTRCA